MAIKPHAQTILKTYTLDELLKLVKIKVDRISEERLTDVKSHINALNQAIGGVAPLKKAARPVTKKTVTAKTFKKRARSKKRKLSLGEHLLEILGSKPQKIEQIMAAIRERGHKSKSKDPRRVLYLELKKQLEKKTIQKVRRGVYKRK